MHLILIAVLALISVLPTTVGSNSVFAQDVEEGRWRYIPPVRKADLVKFGWIEDGDSFHFSGPILICAVPNPSDVSFSMPVDEDTPDGSQVTVRVTNGETAVVLQGEVGDGPSGMSFYLELPQHHQIFTLFRSDGMLTFESSALRQPLHYSLQDAPDLFERFSSECKLS